MEWEIRRIIKHGKKKGRTEFLDCRPTCVNAEGCDCDQLIKEFYIRLLINNEAKDQA